MYSVLEKLVSRSVVGTQHHIRVGTKSMASSASNDVGIPICCILNHHDDSFVARSPCYFKTPSVRAALTSRPVVLKRSTAIGMGTNRECIIPAGSEYML